jgi:hypothetical protein
MYYVILVPNTIFNYTPSNRLKSMVKSFRPVKFVNGLLQVKCKKLPNGWDNGIPSVIHGDGRGRHIGIPTANLQIWPEKRLPEPGVYAAWAWVENNRLPSVLNLGYRPTFEKEKTEPRLEVHIMDFSSDLYDQQVRLEIVQRLRPEKRFSSVDILLAQIHSDIQSAREVLSNVS